MKKKSIAKNYIYNLIYQILIILLPLITTPYVSRILGVEAIGIYGYTLSIVTYFILFGTLGISMYGQREIAYFQDNKNKISKTFWEIILLRCITLFFSTITFFIIYGNEGQYSLYYRILLIHLIANIFDINWLFQGIEEFDKTVIRNLVIKVLCIVLVFTCVKEPGDLWKYYLIYACSEFIGNISIWFYLPKYIDKVKIKTLNLVKHIKPALTLFLPQIAVQIYTVLDKTMIGIITNDMNEVGYYEQTQKIVKASIVIISALQIVMNSRIANSYAKKNNKEINNCLRKSFSLFWLIGIPMLFGLIAIARKFVPWYYGAGFEAVTNIIVVLSPIILIIGFSGITGNQYLIQVGKQKIYTFSVIVGAIVNVIFNIILIHLFNSIGACIATLIAELVILSIQLVYFKKQFRIKEIFKISIKNWISGIIMFIILLFVVDKLKISAINTLLEIIIGGAIYFTCLLILKDKFFKDLCSQVLFGIKSILRHK